MTNVSKYFRFLVPAYNPERTGEILSVNPTVAPLRQEAAHIKVCVFDYDATTMEEHCFRQIKEVFHYSSSGQRNVWINIDGIRKKDIEAICEHFEVHNLVAEDILSIGQRPKMDEMNDTLYFLLNMLYFNEKTSSVETEQISIILGKNFVLSFQEDDTRDVFNPLRDKLKIQGSKVRQADADYLCYTMIDLIVDNYYLVLEKLGDRIELLEELIIKQSDARTLAQINSLRKELIVLKRNVAPVRDMVSSINRTDSKLVDKRTAKYFKDVYDHIVQAHDMTENYRDMMMSLQDLYMSQVNLKANEVMKLLAIVTCLLAPATVIGGIFGMNFDSNVNFFHQPWGFYTAVALMLIIPILMIIVFRKRGWF
jgi:magnesium transporter